MEVVDMFSFVRDAVLDGVSDYGGSGNGWGREVVVEDRIKGREEWGVERGNEDMNKNVRRPRKRNDMITQCSDPRDGELGRCDALLRCEGFNGFDEFEVVFEELGGIVIVSWGLG
jgi:hypothetical protein